MITIGKTKTKRLKNGTTVDVPAVVVRKTKGTLDGSFGPDRNRQLKVELVDGDLVRITPFGTRQSHEASLFDVFRWMLKTKANSAALEKARVTKAKKHAQKLAAFVKAQDRRITRQARKAHHAA